MILLRNYPAIKNWLTSMNYHETVLSYNNDDNNNNNDDNNNNSNLFAKPCCSPAAEVSFLNGFFDAERRNLLVHGIAASRYWNHVKTVGLWA